MGHVHRRSDGAPGDADGRLYPLDQAGADWRGFDPRFHWAAASDRVWPTYRGIALLGAALHVHSGAALLEPRGPRGGRLDPAGLVAAGAARLSLDLPQDWRDRRTCNWNRHHGAAAADAGIHPIYPWGRSG